MDRPVRYIAAASLLYEAAYMLQPPERLCFVTGMKLLSGRLIVLTQLISVIAASSSEAHVQPDAASVFQAQQDLWGKGQDIEAQFHSHPGHSRSATKPSTTDLNTARRWETGAPFIGAIFSEGGQHVRFFNYAQQSEVIIYGSHIRTPEPLLFDLPENSRHPMPPEAHATEGLAPDGPAAEIALVEAIEDFYQQNSDGRLRRARQQFEPDLFPNGTWRH